MAVNIDVKIPIIRVTEKPLTGPLPKENKASAANKVVVIKKYLDTGKYARVRLFDDHKENLTALLGLKREYPQVEMFAYLADKNGGVKRIK